MWKKLKELFLKFIQRNNFVHPVLDETVNSAIDGKIKRTQKIQQELSDKYNTILNNYLLTYFSRKYANQSEMAIAFKATNKEWESLCRKVNSTEKLINLKKEAFKNNVKLVIEKTKINNEKKAKAE